MGPAKLSLDAYEKGDLETALYYCIQAANIAPHVAEFASTAGAILHDLKRYAEALVWHRKAIACRSVRAEVYSNYSNTLRAVGDLSGAHDWNYKALKKDRFNSFVLNNQGCVETEMGDLPNALRTFDRAIAANPKNYDAYFNRGNAMLLGGDYSSDAWEAYDYRILTRNATQQLLPFPWWLGHSEPLHGKSIFIEVEQGAGDTFQFARYLYALRDYYPSAKITFQVGDPLFEIMSHNLKHICEVVPGEYTIKEPYDYRALLLNLPRVFPDYIGFTPYLRPLTYQKVSNGKLSVGICWKGNPDHKNDHNRSIHDSALLHPLLFGFNSDDVQFFSLQKGEAVDRAATLPLVDWSATFSFINSLDLIITVDTSIAHVAGALGRPVWLMVPKAPDWRWGLEGNTSRWYPTAKIYRQALRGNWKPVIENVFTDLMAQVKRGAL